MPEVEFKRWGILVVGKAGDNGRARLAASVECEQRVLEVTEDLVSPHDTGDHIAEELVREIPGKVLE